MKIKESELRTIIREALVLRMKTDPESVKKIANIKESTDFVARREIQASIDRVVLDIEKDVILKALDIIDPNKLDPKLQAAYLSIANNMREGIKAAIQDAVKKLSPFPRNSTQTASGVAR